MRKEIQQRNGNEKREAWLPQIVTSRMSQVQASRSGALQPGNGSSDCAAGSNPAGIQRNEGHGLNPECTAIGIGRFYILFPMLFPDSPLGSLIPDGIWLKSGLRLPYRRKWKIRIVILQLSCISKISKGQAACLKRRGPRPFMISGIRTRPRMVVGII